MKRSILLNFTLMRILAACSSATSALLQIDAPPAEFEAFAAEADQVLQTLKLSK